MDWITNECIGLNDEIAHALACSRSHIPTAKRGSLLPCASYALRRNHPCRHSLLIPIAPVKHFLQRLTQSVDFILAKLAFPSLFDFTNEP